MSRTAPIVDAPLIAHRGASLDAPENTIAAVELAARRGARWVETDVRLTGDGGLVILHDATLDRTTNGSGAASRTALAEIMALDAGAWFSAEYAGARVPTLEQFLRAVLECGLCLQLELKETAGREEALVSGVARALEQHWPIGQRGLFVSSFSEYALRCAAKALPEIPRAFASEFIPPDPKARLADAHAQILHVQHAAVTEPELQMLRGTEIEFAVATINEPALARQFLERGATSVLSDIPDLLDL